MCSRLVIICFVFSYARTNVRGKKANDWRRRARITKKFARHTCLVNFSRLNLFSPTALAPYQGKDRLFVILLLSSCLYWVQTYRITFKIYRMISGRTRTSHKSHDFRSFGGAMSSPWERCRAPSWRTRSQWCSCCKETVSVLFEGFVWWGFD